MRKFHILDLRGCPKKPEALESADFMPLGLNRGGFPPGAILREIK